MWSLGCIFGEMLGGAGHRAAASARQSRRKRKTRTRKHRNTNAHGDQRIPTSGSHAGRGQARSRSQKAAPQACPSASPQPQPALSPSPQPQPSAASLSRSPQPQLPQRQPALTRGALAPPGKPVFPGTSTLNQLELICGVVGKPNEQQAAAPRPRRNSQPQHPATAPSRQPHASSLTCLTHPPPAADRFDAVTVRADDA